MRALVLPDGRLETVGTGSVDATEVVAALAGTSLAGTALSLHRHPALIQEPVPRHPATARTLEGCGLRLRSVLR